MPQACRERLNALSRPTSLQKQVITQRRNEHNENLNLSIACNFERILRCVVASLGEVPLD
jgi:hypothetical protein